MKFYCKSHIGHRRSNQDSMDIITFAHPYEPHFEITKMDLYDGIGGYMYGDVCAKIGKTISSEVLLGSILNGNRPTDFKEILKQAIIQADKTIKIISKEKNIKMVLNSLRNTRFHFDFDTDFDFEQRAKFR